MATDSVKTGGACFTPRLNPRPLDKYPSAAKVITGTLISIVRNSALCALVTYSLHPLYLAYVNAMLDSGWSERAIFTSLLLAIHTCCYVGINGFFLACSKMGWFAKYQFDRKPYQIPTSALLNRTFWEAFLNQCVTAPFVTYFAFSAFLHFGMPSLTSPLPSLPVMLGSFITARLFNDIFFYFSHRTVHHPMLYKWIHKQHHSYTGSIGVAAEFASPMEQILSNQGPTIGGCLFFGAHPMVFFVWVLARIEQTYEGHSGFCFNGSWLHKIGLTNADAAAYHDYHHSGNRGNFGAVWLDWLCGTMDAYVVLGWHEGYIEQCKNIGVENAKKGVVNKGIHSSRITPEKKVEE